MFWNGDICNASSPCGWWTLNMKCFEIVLYLSVFTTLKIWTLNMKCFEIDTELGILSIATRMNLKHEMFWNIISGVL